MKKIKLNIYRKECWPSLDVTHRWYSQKKSNAIYICSVYLRKMKCLS